jgi:hypothetical protein
MTDIDILDIGGARYQWDYLKSPAKITILNKDNRLAEDASKNYVFVEGDALHLSYRDKEFDLAFSNSVIEHVGNYQDQIQFANEMRRVCVSLYCQTPNKWFFIEPHLIAPLIHWLPFRIQRHLIRWLSVWGWVTKPQPSQVDDFIRSIRLLTYKELKELFPDCVILREKLLGFTKSFIIVRGAVGVTSISEGAN